MNYVFVAYGDELYHHGVMGQKWGVRRYQNSDGTYTSAGKARRNNSSSERKGLTDKQKKALKVGAAVVGTAAVAAGALYIAKTNPELVAKGAKFIKTASQNVGNSVKNNAVKISKEAPTMVKNTAVKISKEAPVVVKNTAIKGAKFTKALAKNAGKGIVEGAIEASKDGPKKLTKAVITGAIMVAGKKYLDSSIGKHNSDAVFKSNDPKNIGKYWNVLNEKEKEDD